ncbi:unnamed protein product, partial [Closterium sp. NIES-53]
PPMFITLYFIVTRLPDSLRSVRDHFLTLDPTSLTVDLLEHHLLASETSAVAVGAARGTPRSPFFEGCSPSPLSPSFASSAAADVLVPGTSVLLQLVQSAATARARVGGVVEEAAVVVEVAVGTVVGTAVEEVEVVVVVAAVGLLAPVEALVAAVAAAEEVAAVEAVGPVVVGLDLGAQALVVVGASTSSVGARLRRPSSSTCAKYHTERRFFARLDDAWCTEFGDDDERPHWAELLRSGVAIFDLDHDVIISAMYALSFSAEGDCYRCVQPDPGIAGAALGASASGTPPGTAPCTPSRWTPAPRAGPDRCHFLHCPPMSGGSVRLIVRSSPPLVLYELGSSQYTLATEPPQPLLWHHLLGHPSLPRLRGMHSRLLVPGLPRSLPPLPPSPAPPCLPCVEGRQRAAPHSSSFPPTTAPLQTLHMDVWGPARVSGQGRKRYFLLVVDDYTWYTTVFPLRSKGEVFAVLIPWICTLRLQLSEWFGQDLLVLRLHFDRGGEFSSDLLRDFCPGEVITQSFTLPNSPQQNGFAERRIGLVMEFYHPTLRRVLPSQDVTFDESVPFYHLFLYRSAPPPPPSLFLAPSPPLPGGAGSEGAGSGGFEPERVEPGGAESEGAEPRGAESEGAEPGGAESEGAESGAPRAGEPGDTGAGGAAVTTGAGDPTEPGAAGAGGAGAGVGGVGGPGAGGAGAAGAGAVDPRAGGARGTPASPLPLPSPYTEQSGGLTECREPASRPVSPVRTACCSPRSRPPPIQGTHTMAIRHSFVPLRVPLPAQPESSLPEVLDPESDRARAASLTVARLLATAINDPSFKSAAASALVAELLDYAAACRLDYAFALVAESVPASPPSVGGECALGTDVLEDRQEDFECQAITGPYSSQWQAAVDAEMASWNSTGTYVDEVPPPGANIVDGMWIFRGVDYFQTFSPTPKMTTLWVLLHVAAQRDYELHSLYFSTAFLQGSLHEEIWLRRPPGFTGLNKAIYSLKQAARCCHARLEEALETLGFKVSGCDESLFMTEGGEEKVFLLVYVDDILVFSPSLEGIKEVQGKLKETFQCKALWPVGYYLGLHVEQDEVKGWLRLHQHKYLAAMGENYGLEEGRSVMTPLPSGFQLHLDEEEVEVLEYELQRRFQSMVGSLMYASVNTRPDIAFPVSLLARVVSRPLQEQLDAAERLVRYCMATSRVGLQYSVHGQLKQKGVEEVSTKTGAPARRGHLEMERLNVAYN